MSVATDTLAFFRNHWATRFTDTCTITRTTGRTLNQTTGVYTPTTATRYSGPCLVRPQSPASASVGEEQVERRGYIVFIPYNEEDVGIDDIVTVTSTFDGVLDGKELVVTNVQADSYNTSRKLETIDNQGSSG